MHILQLRPFEFARSLPSDIQLSSIQQDECYKVRNFRTPEYNSSVTSLMS